MVAVDLHDVVADTPGNLAQLPFLVGRRLVLGRDPKINRAASSESPPADCGAA